MWEFLHRKYNILLSTSIIESGLDIPSVNTLIVEEAEDFGLSQLYQLRGRVGRERQKAFCYLFYSPGSELTEDARKRLGALKEFASLGSGFRLALRDLEIRGAGNLLGPQQHGFMNAIGVDLYGQLLSDEIKRQKGETVSRPAELEPELEIPVSAYIPEDYLPSEAERVAFYKRLLDTAVADLPRLRRELEDRCGRLPEPAERLFGVAELRHIARRKKVLKMGVVRRALEIRFHQDAVLAPEAIDSLMKRHAEGVSFVPGPPFGIRLGPPPPPDVLARAMEFLNGLEVGTK
jgi:transcription-repair coupling factor (superfamily II helicase)